MTHDSRVDASDPTSSTGGPAADPSTLLTVLTTQHFALQSAASTTVSEAVGRASTFLGVLSSSLIAVGFATSRPHLLLPSVAVLGPTVFVLGVFTVIRIVDTSGENLRHLGEMARIRGWYATLSPEAARFFTPASAEWTDDAFGGMGLRRTRLSGASTLATMVAFVDAVVGGATVDLVLQVRRTAAPGVAFGGGCVFGAVCLASFLLYQHRRFSSLRRSGGVVDR